MIVLWLWCFSSDLARLCSVSLFHIKKKCFACQKYCERRYSGRWSFTRHLDTGGSLRSIDDPNFIKCSKTRFTNGQDDSFNKPKATLCVWLTNIYVLSSTPVELKTIIPTFPSSSASLRVKATLPRLRGHLQAPKLSLIRSKKNNNIIQ